MTKSNKLNHIALIPDGNRRYAKERNFTPKEAYEIGAENVLYITKYLKEAHQIPMVTVWLLSYENIINRTNDELKIYKELITKIIDRTKEEGYTTRVIGNENAVSSMFGIDWYVDYMEQNSVSPYDSVNYLVGYSGSKEFSQRIPDIDLVIRTGGDKRLSDFAMKQCAHAEIHFEPKHWPGFLLSDLDAHLDEYYDAEKRHGA
jgi:undecaprenyl pyrophosphate synthase